MLIVGIQGTELSKRERAWLAEPEVAGVILFSRNYLDRDQLRGLIDAIRSSRDQPLLVSVDQEGGVVQRFREGFTALPALAALGRFWQHDPALARQRTEEHAWVMASELRVSDVDISFAPVLDLARGNRAIGTRALHTDPDVVADLGQAYVRGMRMAGMAVTVKHFPGHGSVLEDPHVEKACDPRPVEALFREDLEPFRAALAAGAEAVMM
ncbi:MAG TPA: beta-N-acetylhexosaminidase, partial [Mizugakiibacter sp.]|nr:beta-N-acetylhexosaminidase [Mizugakiibacter sp.]